MMRSASRQALVELRRRQEAALGANAGAGAFGGLADELYAVADLLVGQPRLRRALGDPATAPSARTDLARRLFDGKISGAALEVVTAAVEQRWSSPWDLTDALERAGDDALFAAAEADGVLNEVEDELFRVERIFSANGELVSLLDEQAAPAERRVELASRLLRGKVSSVTQRLVEHAVRSQRKRSVTLAVDDLLEQAADRQERSIARVVSATPLTDRQQQRLQAALGDLYGRKMVLRAAVDPSIRGGLVVRVGDEVIDGSVASRLAGARAALAT
ncbi:MAG: F0F1 ATP synthase subunit delta [Jatrophihabitans sp.]|uniref:F0F1 ATP synthase subunit delta n=1 Tax=Jatrophihabitans sp. TaxID=1932789 RepID=UPI003F7E2C15